MVPFDINRRPGRPTNKVKGRHTSPTEPTHQVSATPEQRTVVSRNSSADRRRQIERRHKYQTIKLDKRKLGRRSEDNREHNESLPEHQLRNISVDLKV